ESQRIAVGSGPCQPRWIDRVCGPCGTAEDGDNSEDQGPGSEDVPHHRAEELSWRFGRVRRVQTQAAADDARFAGTRAEHDRGLRRSRAAQAVFVRSLATA